MTVVTKQERVLAVLQALGGRARVDDLTAEVVRRGRVEPREILPALTLLAIGGRVQPIDDGEIVQVIA